MIGRELVYSRRYDANRKSVETSRLYIHMVLVKKLSKILLGFGVFGHTFFHEDFFAEKIASNCLHLFQTGSIQLIIVFLVFSKSFVAAV